MPRLNSRGSALMGVADGPVSIDGEIISPKGGPTGWIDDDTAIFQSRELTLRVYHVPGQTFADIPGSDGANELAAGGGRYLAYRAGRGLYGALSLPSGGVSLAITDMRGAIGRDGTLAYLPDRHAGTPTVLLAQDGQQTTIHGAAYGIQVLGPGKAIWIGGSIGIDPPHLRHPDGRVVLAGAWVIYWSLGVGLVAHPFLNSSLCIVVEPRPAAFYHDAVVVDGRLIVAYSTGQGEFPNELVKLGFTADDLRAWPTLTPPPPPPPPPPPDPDPEPDPMPTIDPKDYPRLVADGPVVAEGRRLLRDPSMPGRYWTLDQWRDAFHAITVKHGYQNGPTSWEKLRDMGPDLNALGCGPQRGSDGRWSGRLYFPAPPSPMSEQHADLQRRMPNGWDQEREQPGDHDLYWWDFLRFVDLVSGEGGWGKSEWPWLVKMDPGPPPRTGEEPPPPNGDLRDAVTRLEIEQAAMRASLEEANRHLAALTGRLTALEGRPPGGVQPGHPVEVSGSVSLSDAFSSRKVTWQGKVK